MSATLPSFESFFTVLHNGRQPFPWQARLASDVLARGWPSLLDLPTGVGKTSALDVALYALAARPDVMPRRTVLVVDRRVVVEQGARHARQVLDTMMAASDGPVRQVADALRSLHGARADEVPFAIAELRGGMPRDNDWAHRPDVPVLGVSTVDQVGSRLLFRGYGISPRSASIHAGLLGNDTLILLDEVHLSEPFAQTLASIARLKQQATPSVLPERFAVVRMSATAGASEEQPFRLDVKDLTHPVLARRLGANKYATLVPVPVTGKDEARKRALLAEHIAHLVMELRAAPVGVVGVVVNRVDTARLLHRLLVAGDERCLLVTGRMRPLERDALVRDTLFPYAGAGRDRAAARPLVVVATQCIEAGADLDFDAIVTECASLDALRQRFGRVDRLGELGTSRSYIVCRSDQVRDSQDDPVYGAALAATWQRLQDSAEDGVVNMGIDGQRRITPGDGIWSSLLAPRPDAPVLLPAHVDLWSQTSQGLGVQPEVSDWLHGPARASADVQVVWRSGLVRETASSDTPSFPPVIDRDPARVIPWLEACRPSSLEAISLPIGVVRRWLRGDAPDDAGLSDTVTSAVADAADDGRRNSSEELFVGWRWAGDASEPVTGRDLRPGDILVVDATRGGIAAGSFDPESSEPVIDLGDLAQLRGRGIASLRLESGAMRVWGFDAQHASDLKRMVEMPDDATTSERREGVRSAIAQLSRERGQGAVATADDLVALQEALQVASGRRDFGLVKVADRVFLRGSIASTKRFAQRVQDATSEDDLSAFVPGDATLASHSALVRDTVQAFAEHLGLPDTIVSDLAMAGWLHDTGKADPRFQKWLLGGSEIGLAMLTEPLAKSAVAAANAAELRTARERAGYPAGYRHEELSVAMAQSDDRALANASDVELVLHLIASHHGGARPFAAAISEREPVDVELAHGDLRLRASTAHGLARLDSGVADRFWRLTARYGWWGLAWCEALLRLADHRASEAITQEGA